MASCPRLQALPRYQLYRFFRDWATGHVPSGASAGEVNERMSKVFRGVGEIIWHKVMWDCDLNTSNYHVAAVGTISAGGGLETVRFSAPVIMNDRMEEWVNIFDRQLALAVMCDTGCSLVLLQEHAAEDKRRDSHNQVPLLHISSPPRNPQESMWLDMLASAEKSGAAAGDTTNGRRTSQASSMASSKSVCLQGELLARSIHFTSQIELAIAGGGRSKGCERWEEALDAIGRSLTIHTNGWAEYLSNPSLEDALNTISYTALITQALQHRDTVQLLKDALHKTGSQGQQDSLPVIDSFAWVCHLRYYFSSPAKAQEVLEAWKKEENREEEDREPTPPPVVRVSIGPWHTPYGFEYRGTMERLWVTPLSERCLLHTTHSAKGCLAGLLIPAVARSGWGAAAASGDSVGSATAAEDMALAFGRTFHLLPAGRITSPQAISNALALVFSNGGVTVVAGVDILPNLTLAVMTESLHAVASCLRAGQQSVLVNGQEVSIASPEAHLSPGFDPILHQWKLLPKSDLSIKNIPPQSPLTGVFGTVARTGPDHQLPLTIRTVFRPVLISPPNLPILLKAMLFSNGFSHANKLYNAILEGLENIFEKVWYNCGSCGYHGGSDVEDKKHQPPRDLSTQMLLYNIIRPAVAVASGILAQEAAKLLRVAAKKLSLRSLPASERQMQIKAVQVGVQAKVLIAGLVHSLLEAEKLCSQVGGTGGKFTSLLNKDNKLEWGDTVNRGFTNQKHQNREATPVRYSPKEIESTTVRRAIMVNILEGSGEFAEMIKILKELEKGRTVEGQEVKSHTEELAKAYTPFRAKDITSFLAMVNRALHVSGINPTTEQVKAGVSLWDALWSCRTPAVIVTGPTGVGKSAIIHAMPHMAGYVQRMQNRLGKAISKMKVGSPSKQAQSEKDQPSNMGWPGSPLSSAPHGFKSPFNSRGAAPYRQICNRLVDFTDYVRHTSVFRKGKVGGGNDESTVKTGRSGSSAGTKMTAISGCSDLSGKSTASNSSEAMSVLSFGNDGGVTTNGKMILSAPGQARSLPAIALEDGIFVIPSQELEVVYTGSCRPEHLIGSSDEFGQWHDGTLIRRLRVLAEGGADRHRVGAGASARRDLHKHPDGCSDGVSHRMQSRLLVLDGPVTKLIEGLFTAGLPSGPGLTGAKNLGLDNRCLVLPEGEPLALDSWAHIAIEAGHVRHLSPSALATITIIHVDVSRSDIVRGMLKAWLRKMTRHHLKNEESGNHPYANIIATAVSDFLNYEGFIQ
ncbi:unnamed protein product, partial [Choristocarpus tenellus]